MSLLAPPDFLFHVTFDTGDEQRTKFFDSLNSAENFVNDLCQSYDVDPRNIFVVRYSLDRELYPKKIERVIIEPGD